MTDNQASLLAGIQSLALAAAKQTGSRVIHEVRSATDKMGTYVCSDIRVYDDALELLHQTGVMIGHDGRDDPGKYASAHERTLEQQRDELVEFIAAHRKQEEAA